MHPRVPPARTESDDRRRPANADGRGGRTVAGDRSSERGRSGDDASPTNEAKSETSGEVRSGDGRDPRAGAAAVRAAVVAPSRAVRARGDEDAAPTALVYVRGSVGGLGTQTDVIDELEDLSDAGAVAGVEVRTWPSAVSLRGLGDACHEYVEAFETFESWADEHDATVCPPFAVRRRDSAITHESEEVLLTPALFLTLWEGDDLVDAYPHCEAGTVVTAADGVERIRAALEAPGPEAEAPDTGAGSAGEDAATPQEADR